MKERLVWLPIYVLSCAAVGIFAFFATHNSLKVGLVTAALGAAFGALGWLAMQIPQRPRPYLPRTYVQYILLEAEKAIGSANFVIINRHNKLTPEWEEYAKSAEEDIRKGLAAIREARGQ